MKERTIPETIVPAFSSNPTLLRGLGQNMEEPEITNSLPTLIASLPVYDGAKMTFTQDWLVRPVTTKAGVYRSDDQQYLVLANGLVARTFKVSPNLATVSFKLSGSDTEFVRAVKPEASVELDGQKHEIGGLKGQPVGNYLDPEWLKRMTADPAAYQFQGFQAGRTVERFPWKKRLEWMPHDMPWPPPGASLTLSFARPGSAVAVKVHYEIYDGIPLLSKWITVHNGTDQPVRLNTFSCEILGVVEPESIADASPVWRVPNLFVETDYTFGGMSGPNHSAGVHWVSDPEYPTQVNYDCKTPCMLECRPPLGPDQIIAPGGTFESFRAFELVQDATDRERQGLALRRMYRTVAPWVTENPILMHVRSAEPAAVKLAIDQCADVGFQMVIMTFGSGFNFESRDPGYHARIKDLADYARSKGIALGGYSLLASRGAATVTDNTQGSPPRFGKMPCLGAQWGADYLAQLKTFMQNTGLTVLEHDGSYPGDLCAATNHPYHRGLEDSQWAMWKAITDLYKWCCANGVYLNIPDWYFLNGGTKTGMGYRETNWSLPREFQEIIERQNAFDGTWDKTPSMGWMFVPLTEYHGGGAAATIEPLKEHLPHYEQRLANLFGSGVQACYRGPQLYDAPQTRVILKKWVDFYKAHIEVLNGDIIHLRRATGRDWDGILHVNPQGREKGLAMLYNPLNEDIVRQIKMPLYYTGLTGKAKMAVNGEKAETVKLDGETATLIEVKFPAKGWVWIVFASILAAQRSSSLGAAEAPDNTDGTGFAGVYAASKHWQPPQDSQALAKLSKFQDLKFGFFYCWGTQTQWETIDLSWSLCPERYPWNQRPGLHVNDDTLTYKKAYEELIKTFNPVKFDPQAVADLAEAAGTRYLVFCTKHHDGFCFWNTKTTEYKITSEDCPYHTNPNADVTRALFEAFRKKNFWIGAYFSKPDWNVPTYWAPPFGAPTSRNPNYKPGEHPKVWNQFKDFTWAQIRELMSDYGPVDILWLDGGQVQPRYGQNIDMPGMSAMSRELQRGLLVVDRTAEGGYEDYLTPEGTHAMPKGYRPEVWEACMTLGDRWGWTKDSSYHSSGAIIRYLVRAVARNGNLLLDVGPDAKGEIDPEAVRTLKEIGTWLKVNGEAIYDTRPVIPYERENCFFTQKADGTVYVIVLSEKDGDAPPASITLPSSLANTSQRITLVGSDAAPLTVHAGTNGTAVVDLPAAAITQPPCANAWAVKINSKAY